MKPLPLLICLLLPIVACAENVLTNPADVVRALEQKQLGAKFRLNGTIAYVPHCPWCYHLATDGRLLRFVVGEWTKKVGTLCAGYDIEVSGSIVTYGPKHEISLASMKERNLGRGKPLIHSPCSVSELLSRRSPHLVRVTGKVNSLFRDPLFPEWIFLSLGSESDSIYCITHSPPADGLVLPELVDCVVSVSGLFEANCAYRGNHQQPCVSFKSFADVTILEPAPFWTTFRLILVVFLLIAVLIAFAIYSAIRRKTDKARLLERTRLATELHDYMAQDITAISYQITAAKQMHGSNPEESLAHLCTADRMISSCRTEIRRCLWDLKNEALNERDFSKAVRISLGPLLQGVRFSVTMNVPRTRLDEAMTHNLLSVIRELISNATNHGHADHVTVSGVLDGNRLTMTVRDNGCGFSVEDTPGLETGHFGLSGIRERLHRYRGELRIKSAPGEGTVVTVELQIKMP